VRGVHGKAIHLRQGDPVAWVPASRWTSKTSNNAGSIGSCARLRPPNGECATHCATAVKGCPSFNFTSLLECVEGVATIPLARERLRHCKRPNTTQLTQHSVLHVRIIITIESTRPTWHGTSIFAHIQHHTATKQAKYVRGKQSDALPNASQPTASWRWKWQS
jgi:hypothetical protein